MVRAPHQYNNSAPLHLDWAHLLRHYMRNRMLLHLLKLYYWSITVVLICGVTLTTWQGAVHPSAPPV